MSNSPVPAKPIYLDYASTTPVDPDVARAMSRCLTQDGVFANPASSTHGPGRDATRVVDRARRQVADLVGARPAEIVWTSGATESDNLAIQGVVRYRGDMRCHIVTCRTEHKAVLDTCRQLESERCRVTYLVPDRNGLIRPEQVREALRDDTVLVSIMHVNNEIGVIQDIAAIGSVCAEHEVLFHVDAAQSAGKLPLDLAALPVGLMSFSAHKIYGPKGIGALYVRAKPSTGIAAIIHGGGHQGGLRSGTLATHQIAGMGEAFRLAGERLRADSAHITALRERLWAGIGALGAVSLNGDPDHCVPHILNVCFEGVEGESLIFALGELAVSSGAACSSATDESSYVLRALGRPDHLANSSLRFSLGRQTSVRDIDAAIAIVGREVERLRQIAGGHALA